MKRIVALLLLLAIGCCLFACEKVDHEQILNEISEQNKIRNEKRQAFLDSEVAKEAKEYVEKAIEELVPGGEYSISLEPESLIDADLSAYADFAENPETRADFFDKAHLSFRVNYWDFDIDPLELAGKFVEKQIGGMMMAEQSGSDYYELDPIGKTAKYVQVPGV